MTNAYDGFGRLASSSMNISGVTRTLLRAYDAAGKRTWARHPDGVWFAYNHDALGRPFFMMAQSGPGILFTAYADHGAPAWSYRGDDSFAILAYDEAQRLAALSHYRAGAPGNVATTYTYNPASQIATLTRDNDAYAWTGHYAVNRAYSTDGLNRYITAGAASFTYDANGNLTSDGSRSYAYDVENRLIGASGGVTLTYDPLGRLHQVAVGGSVTTTFLYDRDALVAEYDGSGAMTRRYAHWTGADVPVVSYTGAGLGQPLYLRADHQGSIVALGDPAGAVAINRYDEYGIPAATNQGRFRYTGQIWLPELGMYYYKARMYSPTLGRFPQTDPIGYDDQFNLYAYVGNDPVNATDPSGESGARGCGSLLPQDSASCSGQTLVANAPPLIRQPPPPPGRYHHNWNSDEGNDDFINTVLGCESAMTCAISRDDRAVLSGRMDREEYMERAQARAAGVAAGAAAHIVIQAGSRVAIAAAPSLASAVRSGVSRAFGPNSALFRRGGVLNNNRYFRVGWGSGRRATTTNYYQNFRISIGGPGQRIWIHIDLPSPRHIP